MKLIFLYGPDGSGKTTVAKKLAEVLKESAIIPFEPGKFGTLTTEIDSGYNGENSAVKKAIPCYISFLFFSRYILRTLFFKLRYSNRIQYAIFTRGPIEFGVNDTHRKFPKFFGRKLQFLFSSNPFLISRPVDQILIDKPELPRDRILELYQEYLQAGCHPILNNSLEDCVNDIIKKTS